VAGSHETFIHWESFFPGRVKACRNSRLWSGDSADALAAAINQTAMLD
jgi:hypothetical protein